MGAALSNSKQLSLLPRVVAETKLLRRFAGEAEPFLTEQESYLDNEKYFLASAQSQKIAGFGRGPTKRLALIKAVAEFYERRLMREAYANELSSIPKALQTSNGFAVHFSQKAADEAACNESIERHLLQYSFLKNGWNAFELIGQNTVGENSLTFVASRYSINGLRAGMVLARSKRFPGISFGYFVDQSDKIASSPRWSHAIFEAIDKIEPFLELARSSSDLELMPIEQGILNWMNTSHEEIDFVRGGFSQNLASPRLEIRNFDLAERWGLDFPLFGSYCSSADLLPLLVVDRIDKHESAVIIKTLGAFGLPAILPKRNPVL